MVKNMIDCCNAVKFIMQYLSFVVFQIYTSNLHFFDDNITRNNHKLRFLLKNENKIKTYSLKSTKNIRTTRLSFWFRVLIKRKGCAPHCIHLWIRRTLTRVAGWSSIDHFQIDGDGIVDQNRTSAREKSENGFLLVLEWNPALAHPLLTQFRKQNTKIFVPRSIFIVIYILAIVKTLI